MRGSKRASGYTLLEILIVLTILAGAGFFLLIQIPSNTQEKGIEISSTRLLEDLREVQQAAIASNVWYRVKFFPATSEYKVFKEGEFIRTVSLQKGVRFTSPPSELTLLPTGAPSTGMTIILNSDKFERRIIIAPVMGRIRIEIVR